MDFVNKLKKGVFNAVSVGIFVTVAYKKKHSENTSERFKFTYVKNALLPLSVKVAGSFVRVNHTYSLKVGIDDG